MNKVQLDNDNDSNSSKPEKEEKGLPPMASNGDISLWLDEDKNGNTFVRIDAPFLESEPVFFHDELKPGINQLVEKWEEQRQGEKQ